MVTDFGTVDFEGKTYTLTQEAYVDNYGTRGGVRYYAYAADAEGNEYLVAWDTTPEWDAAQAEADAISQEYAPASAPLGLYPSLLDDESDACDWTRPVEVTAI